MAAAAAAVAAAPKRGFEGRACTPPKGHKIADCRLARHGTPDLSRAAWRALRNAEVTISKRFDALAPNPAAGGARSWPLIDSLAQPMGRLEMTDAGRFMLVALDGTPYRATTVNVRGHGCAASADQSARFPLVQIIAGKANGGGTQAFLDSAAIDRSTPLGAVALRRVRAPARRRHRLRAERARGRQAAQARQPERRPARPRAPLQRRDQRRQGVRRQARLRQRRLLHDEHDVGLGRRRRARDGARRHAGREGRLFDYCDPNSDGTLTWRYWSIRTGVAARPRLYGWIPGRCPKR